MFESVAYDDNPIEAPYRCSTLVGSWPYPQTLDWARKASQGQTSLWTLVNYRCKKFYNIDTWSPIFRRLTTKVVRASPSMSSATMIKGRLCWKFGFQSIKLKPVITDLLLTEVSPCIYKPSFSLSMINAKWSEQFNVWKTLWHCWWKQSMTNGCFSNLSSSSFRP